MTLPADIVSYIMPTMLALSILYFFYARGKLASADTYEDEAKAKQMHFGALAMMLIVVVVWLVFMALSTLATI